ncbi:regulatory protein TetR [Mycolicibacterium rhodesiae JS60]|nr:regulatory protein TetR [Mycolicibacterium rhodesiae JS60]
MPLDDAWDERAAVPVRLIRAADALLRDRGVDDVTIELVAAAAGVARSTAFRHFGGRDRMVSTVALWRARAFARKCGLVMDSRQGTLPKLEAAFTYLTEALGQDAIMRELFILTPGADFGPEALAIASDAFGQTIEAGQQAGDVRNDVSSDEAVRWIVEQLYLAILQSDRTQAAVVRRFRVFIAAALSGGGNTGIPGTVQSTLEVVDAALAQASEAAAALRRTLADGS